MWVGTFVSLHKRRLQDTHTRSELNLVLKGRTFFHTRFKFLCVADGVCVPTRVYRPAIPAIATHE